MNDLTTTQKTILEAAFGHLNGSIHPLPEYLKGGAAMKVIESLLKKGLIEEDGPQSWRISEAGSRALGLEPPQNEETVEETPATTDFETDVTAAETALVENKPRRIRENSKQAQVIAMLKRPEGATAAQIAEVTGWQNHTIRGFISIARKKLGLTITAQRTRMVGPNQEGSPCSFSTYFAG
ncbi:MAG: DUF3489 domain-containing protein [Magnetococcales bacterium]|nr:DUF3489 domain-containing protein [Magnetococcales bacterium]